MSIKLNSIKCPECGANLHVEENRKKLFCSYCGTPIMMTDENEHIYRHIDDAEIAKTETQRMIFLKELEIEEKENERKRKGRKTAYTIALIFAVIGIIMMQFTDLAGLYAVLAAVIIAEFTFIGADNDKKKKTRKTIFENEVQISEKLMDYDEKNYNGVKALYRAAGFTNVSVIPLNDLNMFTIHKNGQVKEVTINGEDDFDEGDIFTKTADVVITYHSLR